MRTLILPALCLQNFLWWLFREILKGSKCAERILRVKRIQKHLQRNGQLQSGTKLIEINGLPRRQRESRRNCQMFLLEYPFTDASAVTAGFEYHWTGASAVAVETVGSGYLLAALLQRKDCSGRAWLGMGLTGMIPVSFTLWSAIFILIQIPWLASFLLLINVWSVCGTHSKGVLLCQKNKDLLSVGAGHHWFAVAACFSASFSRCTLSQWVLFAPITQHSSKSHAQSIEDWILAQSWGVQALLYFPSPFFSLLCFHYLCSSCYGWTRWSM